MSLSSIRPRSSLEIPPVRIAPSDTALSGDVFDGSSLSRTGTGAPRVAVLDPIEAARHRDAWIELQARALEPNVFLDPDLVFAAAQHLGSTRRPRIALVWDGPPNQCRLIAVHAVARLPLWRRSIVRPWSHELVPFGPPLIDRERSSPAATALLDWAAGSDAAGLMFRSLPTHGPAAAAIMDAARERGFRVETIAAWERAVLWQGPAAGPSGGEALSAKGAKEARRQRRRLAEHGTIGYASARSEEDLRDALESFLALEARGWKGCAGTALLMEVGGTAFTRAMTRLLRHRDRCRIDSVTLDGVPIAMGIVLSDGGSDFLWKIAYDERFARLSPGVQFVLDLTARQTREARAAITDSCAIPDHPMIDRLWRDRLALSDVVVCTGPGSGLAVSRVRLHRGLRDWLKRARAKWKNRRTRAAV